MEKKYAWKLLRVESAGDKTLKVDSSSTVSKTILFNLCGYGHFDMQAYIDYQAGQLVDTEYSAAEVAMALAGLPVVG
ncbi:hypothetical protein [Nostoc sp.]|uniref:hypothetical protein n=1 Tax=Nostoc sp. TaxID=1180 RepID=UPI002FF60321